MATTVKQLEKRLARVEQEIAELRDSRPKKRSEPSKRMVRGAVREDVYAEITRLGAEYRRQQREP